ncbi:hypothetical protein SuNHUV7_06790 (plasmid) [Pseudoseohaeicola sp. NH-UV-7]|uniref:hypothetical protein n=1 Tax=unclassified Sulfitobacter TaxID=196795 RepID=UPI000E0B9207|nr:hypothetical protein [Sulfitobacter sp. JL08]AXI56498.1 hypothetical protein C1J05_20080 [Sulfitobacter sp. JL08]
MAAVAAVEAEQTNMVDPKRTMPPAMTIPLGMTIPPAMITETMGMNMATKAMEKGQSTEVVVRRLNSEEMVATPWLNGS